VSNLSFWQLAIARYFAHPALLALYVKVGRTGGSRGYRADSVRMSCTLWRILAGRS